MKKFFLLLIFALVAVTLVQLSLTSGAISLTKAAEQKTAPETADIGGDFTLTDQNGKTVHPADYHGHLMLIFFGFTSCPDICPVTVANMSKALEFLGPHADQVQGLFISVDPKHDTPKILKNFLANFNGHITGLTGTPEQIKQVAEAYKAYYSQPDKPSGTADYNIDHSAFIYLMGKDGKFIRILPYNTSAQDLAHAINTIIGQ